MHNSDSCSCCRKCTREEVRREIENEQRAYENRQQIEMYKRQQERDLDYED